MNEFPLFVANEARTSNSWLNVTNKYSHEVAARVAQAGASELEQAIQAAHEAAPVMRKLAAYQRKAILEHTVTRCRERAEELAYWLCVEAGKPINDARGEVGRLIDTMQISAEEAIRINGEMLPLDIS
ncbi:MAG TPA: aldehyde dehydrogenase family protein, partial [Pseudomonadales bacterium]|nr:aldehyde dehydrogenase family protein [Pseudomonadales bacterium]